MSDLICSERFYEKYADFHQILMSPSFLYRIITPTAKVSHKRYPHIVQMDQSH